jgi:transposase
LSQQEIAQRLGVSEAAVSQWRKVLREQGMKGAKAKQSSGRPTKLSSDEQARLLKLLRQGAKEAGFISERWTQARICKIIQQEFGVAYHFRSVGRLLNQLGWSLQQPQGQPRERDEALIEAWLKQDWPRIKKSTATRRRHHVY